VKIKNVFLISFVGLFLLAACVGGGSETSRVSGSINSVVGLIEALEEQGAQVAESDRVEQPFFSVIGRGVTANGQALQVFEYGDTDTAAQEAKSIAPDGSSVGTSMMMWVDDPHFFQQENLIVLYLGSDASTLDLLETLLGPQIAGR
jgi:hypothetical protein